MPTMKSETVSLRVSATFKRALKAAAERERRSQTNLLEYLLFSYCQQNGIATEPSGDSRDESR